MEQFSWIKFLKGLVDPTAYFKTLAIVVRVALIVLVIWGVWIAGNFIQQRLAPKKQQPAVFTTTGQVGGQTKNSADQKQFHIGILNF